MSAMPEEAKRPAESEAAILAATREILAESGVRGLTMEGVAARAGVAKTTVYRRWGSKEDLALEVLLDMASQVVVAVPDLESTREELVAFVDGSVNVLRTTLMGRVIQGLVPELAADPELAGPFREQVVAMRVAEARRLVERGIARGDLRPDVDITLANELLFGPVYYRLLLSGAPLEPGLAERIVDAVLPAFAAGGPDAAGSRAHVDTVPG
jgi:AcrR family transcriptional regulator